MVKLAAEIVCLWKASSVFPSGKKYQGAGVWMGRQCLLWWEDVHFILYFSDEGDLWCPWQPRVWFLCLFIAAGVSSTALWVIPCVRHSEVHCRNCKEKHHPLQRLGLGLEIRVCGVSTLCVPQQRVWSVLLWFVSLRTRLAVVESCFFPWVSEVGGRRGAGEKGFTRGFSGCSSGAPCCHLLGHPLSSWHSPLEKGLNTFRGAQKEALSWDWESSAWSWVYSVCLPWEAAGGWDSPSFLLTHLQTCLGSGEEVLMCDPAPAQPLNSLFMVLFHDVSFQLRWVRCPCCFFCLWSWFQKELRSLVSLIEMRCYL